MDAVHSMWIHGFLFGKRKSEFIKWKFSIFYYFQVLFGRFYVRSYIDDHKKRRSEKLLANNNAELQKNQNLLTNGKKHE